MPWTRLMGALGENRFDDIRKALEEAKVGASDRDAFLLNAAVGQLFRELVPEEAPPDAVSGYGALLHMLYLHWERRWPVAIAGREALARLLAAPAPLAAPTPPIAVCYLQLPELVVWAAPDVGAPHEPVDGLFTVAAPGEVRALAVLGLRPEREGFTTIESVMSLPAAAPGPRPDGSAPFASVLPAGARAALFSIENPHELAALAVLALQAAHG